MAIEKIEGINPTRMELLKLKTKVKLAVKGHKLLKQKRDALIMEFFNVLAQAKGIRKKAAGELAEAFGALIMAEASSGTIKVAEASLAVRANIEIGRVESRNVMGVKVPTLELGETKRGILERGYGIADTSSQLDEASRRFEESLKTLVELAEIEKSIRLLAREIERTKRRVSSLENILIPRLDATVKYIKMRLDEMERESFFKLKRIKAMMEAREEAGPGAA
ncbi:MAG: V-type ATP synthase subunit D [Candidatus Hydrothermarchaeota archaeon]